MIFLGPDFFGREFFGDGFLALIFLSHPVPRLRPEARNERCR
jgi:hypothetical protein